MPATARAPRVLAKPRPPRSRLPSQSEACPSRPLLERGDHGAGIDQVRLDGRPAPADQAAQKPRLRGDDLELDLLAESLPHHAAQLAEAVDEPELHGLDPRPYRAREERVAPALEALAAARRDERDEFLVDAH